MNDIKITIGNGGLGRDKSNYDVISGLAIYTDLKDDSAFASAGINLYTNTDRIHTFTSLEEFETATGITFNNANTEEIWYQVKEFFRLAGNVKVYIALFYDTNYETTPVVLDYSEVEDLQKYADGEIRQIGVYTSNAQFSTTDSEKLQTVADNLFSIHMPVSIVFGANTDTTDLNNLPDLRNLSTPAKNVSVVILQDGANYGANLANNVLGHSVPAVGAVLGTVSSANVNESIAWIQKFNLSGSGELDVPAFGNGNLVKNTLGNTLDQLNNYGYLFGIKHVGINGTYLNDNSTCDVITSDYAYMAEVRTIDKAVRNVRKVLLPYLNSPVKINSEDGTLDSLFISSWSNVISNELLKMVQNSELSGYQVYIDPDQNVVVSSTIKVSLSLVPYGTARDIEVEIGFVATL